MIKASAGGGGKGMRIAWNDNEARLKIPQLNEIWGLKIKNFQFTGKDFVYPNKRQQGNKIYIHKYIYMWLYYLKKIF